LRGLCFRHSATINDFTFAFERGENATFLLLRRIKVRSE
jgi:hypothetical protein